MPSNDDDDYLVAYGPLDEISGFAITVGAVGVAGWAAVQLVSWVVSK